MVSLKKLVKVKLGENSGIIVLSRTVIFYRAPEARSLMDVIGPDGLGGARHLQASYPQIGKRMWAVFVDKPSRDQIEYPLWYHILAGCLTDKPMPYTQFRKTGGGGTPLPARQHKARVLSQLLRDLRAFPEGWSDVLEHLEAPSKPLEVQDVSRHSAE